MSIEPDTKDWTWVLAEACPECGFDAPELDLARLPQALRDNATLWQVVLGTPDAAVRPAAHIWSPLEYACHVRDAHRLFDGRVRQTLDEHRPRYAGWDQDVAAVEGDYGAQDPTEVAAAVVSSAGQVARTYESVTGDDWLREGERSDGRGFTIDTIARYHLHDVVHHAHDVSYVTKRVTVDSYEAFAPDYAEATSALPPEVAEQLATFAKAVGEGGRVLEIGSAQGRDADALEQRGLSVRRTDITSAFVRMLRARGLDADVVDPLHDDLRDPGREAPYDGVWAAASLLHVRREDLPSVLERLAEATRPGGVLGMSVKEGDGARVSTHGNVDAPRHFTFWREQALRDVLAEAGWQVEDVSGQSDSKGQGWLVVRAAQVS